MDTVRNAAERDLTPLDLDAETVDAERYDYLMENVRRIQGMQLVIREEIENARVRSRRLEFQAAWVICALVVSCCVLVLVQS